MEARLAASPHLLVVEPDAALRGLLGEALSEEGAVTCGAATLEEALALVDHRAFDLILTDAGVGASPDSLCIARTLRHRAQPTPVGVLTAWNLTPEAGNRCDLAFVLPKPFELDQLLAQVAVALGAPPGHRGALPDSGERCGGASGTSALEPSAR
jgi:DNA-binding response OmpR family regulator